MRSAVLATLLAIPAVLGHFTLDFPMSRGFDEDLEPMYCGGFNLSTRVPYPLNSAPIQIDSHHESAQLAIFVSFNTNPTSFAQFNSTDNGTAYGPVMNFTTITGEGEHCFNIDIASLNLPGVGNGTLATIQVEFNGGDGILLQCADVILSTSYTPPSNATCNAANDPTSALSGTAATATAATTSATATTSKSAASVGKVGKGLAGLMGFVGAVALIA